MAFKRSAVRSRSAPPVLRKFHICPILQAASTKSPRLQNALGLPQGRCVKALYWGESSWGDRSLQGTASGLKLPKGERPLGEGGKEKWISSRMTPEGKLLTESSPAIAAWIPGQRPKQGEDSGKAKGVLPEKAGEAGGQ